MNELFFNSYVYTNLIMMQISKWALFTTSCPLRSCHKGTDIVQAFKTKFGLFGLSMFQFVEMV